MNKYIEGRNKCPQGRVKLLVYTHFESESFLFFNLLYCFFWYFFVLLQLLEPLLVGNWCRSCFYSLVSSTCWNKKILFHIHDEEAVFLLAMSRLLGGSAWLCTKLSAHSVTFQTNGWFNIVTNPVQVVLLEIVAV